MRNNSTKKEKSEQRSEALRLIVENYGVKPGTKIYSKVESVARSGMSRTISFYVVKDNEILDVTYLFCRILDYPRSDTGGLRIGGCGMDMGFHCIYNLGRALWPNGTPEPHGTRNREPDSDGGYALKQMRL